MSETPHLSRLALTFSLCIFGCSETPGADPSPPAPPHRAFWVAESGSDDGSGTADAPFATLAKARDAVRSIPRSSPWTGDVVVHIGEGTYRLTEPLRLTTEDSGRDGHNVVYRAATGARPELTGGTLISGWETYAPVPGVYRARAEGLKSRQLFVNGERKTRARTTPYPAKQYPVGFLPKFYDLDKKPFLEVGIEYVVSEQNPAGFRDPSAWTRVADIEAVIVTQWKMMIVPLESVVASINGGLLKMQEPAWTNANAFLSPGLFSKALNGALDEPGIWSFWQVSRFENALEFLDEPGEWYLDATDGWLYFYPERDEDPRDFVAELATTEILIEGLGQSDQPIHNVVFQGLTFRTATWLAPGSSDGYVVDQSGFHLTGRGHAANTTGHFQNVTRTPGNVRFRNARDITFSENIFTQLGGVALDFSGGSHRVTVEDNLFLNVSSAAIQLGGVSAAHARPATAGDATRDNTLRNNMIRNTGLDYVDAAGVFVGFSENTLIEHNTIMATPWAGLAMGWGWGLLDAPSYPGIPNATPGQWGDYTTPTQNRGNRILNNDFRQFIQVVWDAGAIYTCGQQGTADSPLRIEGNVATAKRPGGGGNVIYTDGGSRYITVKGNALYDNPQGKMYFGPPPPPFDPLPYADLASILNDTPYGSDTGGCRTYGDIRYAENYWSTADFFGEKLCPYSADGISYPVNLTYDENHLVRGSDDVPASVLEKAGVQYRPPTIPAELWQP